MLYDAINNFGKLRVKENLAEKLKQIEEIEVTPDCEEVIPRNFAGSSLGNLQP